MEVNKIILLVFNLGMVKNESDSSMTNCSFISCKAVTAIVVSVLTD